MESEQVIAVLVCKDDKLPITNPLLFSKSTYFRAAYNFPFASHKITMENGVISRPTTLPEIPIPDLTTDQMEAIIELILDGWDNYQYPDIEFRSLQDFLDTTTRFDVEVDVEKLFKSIGDSAHYIAMCEYVAMFNCPEKFEFTCDNVFDDFEYNMSASYITPLHFRGLAMIAEENFCEEKFRFLRILIKYYVTQIEDIPWCESTRSRHHCSNCCWDREKFDRDLTTPMGACLGNDEYVGFKGFEMFLKKIEMVKRLPINVFYPHCANKLSVGVTEMVDLVNFLTNDVEVESSQIDKYVKWWVGAIIRDIEK